MEYAIFGWWSLGCRAAEVCLRRGLPESHVVFEGRFVFGLHHMDICVVFLLFSASLVNTHRRAVFSCFGWVQGCVEQILHSPQKDIF